MKNKYNVFDGAKKKKVYIISIAKRVKKELEEKIA